MTSKPWLLLLFILLSVESDLILPPEDEASYSQCPNAVNITDLTQSVIVEITDDDSQVGAVFSSCSNDYYSIESKKNVWYTLLGTGKVMTASTCHPDTDIDAQITLYKDQCITTSCADLSWGSGPGCPGVCIAATSTSISDCAHLGTSISWDSDVNRTYYLQVSQQRNTFGPVVQLGREAAKPCSGSAVLTVTESTKPVNSFACVNALPVWPKDAEPPVPQLNGTRTIVRESCPGVVGPAFGDGLWYSLKLSSNETEYMGNGTQTAVQIPLCNNITGAPITMLIYTGTDCLNLLCMNQYAIRSDESCGSNLVFVATADQIYYLFVVAEPDMWDPDFGLAEVKLSPLDAPALNQECSTAEALVPDGSTTTVLYERAYDPTRNYDPSFEPTLWYTLEAAVNPLRLQICGPGELEVSVGSCSESNVTITQYLSGDCQILPVIEPVGLAVLLRLDSFAGGTSFPVNITVWELDSARHVEHSTCSKALGPLEYGNNDNSSAPFTDALVNPILGGDIQDLARFYYAEVPPDGMFLQGKVCRLSLSGDFDVSMEELFSFEFCSNAVVQGPGTLVTEMDANGCRSISWSSVEKSPLIIGVHGQEEIEFSIQLLHTNASSIPVNDQQPSPYRTDNTGLVTLTLDSPVQGSTANALSDSIDQFRGTYCPNIVSNKPGVWFATNPGPGKDLVVCLKSSGNTSTAQLAVFGSLVDIDVIYEGCLPDAEKYVMDTACITALRWPALEGTLYSILVQTDATESFELSMYSISDAIAEPACLVPGSDPSSNSTENSRPPSTPAPAAPSTMLSPATGSAMPLSDGIDDLVEVTSVPNLSPVSDPSAPTVSNADAVSETSVGSPLFCFFSWKTRVISFSALVLATVPLL